MAAKNPMANVISTTKKESSSNTWAISTRASWLNWKSGILAAVDHGLCGHAGFLHNRQETALVRKSRKKSFAVAIIRP